MANPAYVGGTKVSNGSGATSSVPITYVVTSAGNSIQLNIGCFRSATTPKVVSVTDNKGNVWKAVNPGYGAANRSWGQIWAAVNVAAGSTTVTVNFGSSTQVQYVYLEVHEIANAPIVGCSNGEASTAAGTALTTPNLSMPGANELFVQFGYVHATSAVITVGSGYTAAQNGGTSPLLGASGYELIATQGPTASAMSSSVSGDWVCMAVAWSNALGTLANGEVVLGTNGGAGSIIGTAGGGNDPNNNPTTNALVFDAGSQTAANPDGGGSWTQWYNPNASGDYVGIDCGAPISCDTVLISFNNPTFENALVSPGTAQFQASNDATWTNFVTLFTFNNTSFPPALPLWGTLNNSLALPLAGNYRYYRITLPAVASAPADLEFYGQYYSGVNATCAPVSITNTDGTTGGYSSGPRQVSMATQTLGATIFYTLDGTNPATSGTAQAYSGPITISANTVVQAVAKLSGLSNSRVTLASYHINSIVPTDIPYSVNRNGYRIWGGSGWRMQDTNPSSTTFGQWFYYTCNRDIYGVLESTGSGIDTYQSPDLLNWTYVNNTGNIEQTSAAINRVAVVYNPSNSTYVLWAQQALAANSAVFTAPSPTGPWTLAFNYTSMDGYSTKGDFTLFQDNDGTCYLIIDTNGGPLPDNNSYTTIHKLNAAYTASSGAFVAYNNNTSGNTTPFGRQSEGFAMFRIGNNYYWGSSNLSPWTPGVNLIVMNQTGPLGTWGAPYNPFQPDPSELTDGAAGFWGPGPLTPSQNYAFDSQTLQYLILPGYPGVNANTPALIYFGDRWDFKNFNVIQTTNDSTQGWRIIMLPVAIDPNSGVLTIKWTNNWTFSSAFIGAPPVPAYGLGTPYISTLRIALLTIWSKSPYRLIQEASTGNYYTAEQLLNNQNQGTKALMQVMVQYDPVAGTIVWVTQGVRQTLLYTVTSLTRNPMFSVL